MSKRLSTALAGSSLLVIASVSGAYAAPAVAPSQQIAAADETGTEEIIVTARRKAENLQDVPETVDVVTTQALEKYNILNFVDIVQLVPGLTLNKPAGSGFAESGSMRGITYDETQSTPPTVTYYKNDVPVDAGFLFQSMFDTGQIEVLRGPQGTTRGLISPSGSITITDHTPDLERVGGYVDLSVGSLHNDNYNGAVNIPIVEDKFAIRIAGLRNRDDGGGVRSVINNASPFTTTDAERIVARFAPNDNINAVVSFQHMDNHSATFGGAVFGAGAPGGLIASPYVAGTFVQGPPAGFNGPVIGPNQLANVNPSPSVTAQRLNDLEAKIDWTIAGQKLSYVGGYNKTAFNTHSNSDANNFYGVGGPRDQGMLLSESKQISQELRLSSVNPLFDHLDYTVGGFFKHMFVDQGVDVTGPTYLNGAFGPPTGSPIVQAPNDTFALGTTVTYPGYAYEYGAYGSLTYHFDKKTEITGGIRYDYDNVHAVTTVAFSPAAIALNLGPAGAAVCPAIGGTFGTSYPGICNRPVVQAPFNIPSNGKYHPVVYNVELSHHFTDDLMTYFRTASSFRQGAVQVGPAISGATVPAIIPFLFPNPEKSKSYEVGVKDSLFDKRLVFDVDFYHQTFSGLFYDVLPFYYEKTSIVAGVAPSVSTATLIVVNAPAVVNGIELHATARITPNWTVTPNVSWADGHLTNAKIPCSPPGGGVPTVATFTTAGYLINTCTSNASTSTAPRWNFTIQSEYDHHINESLDGFLRGLVYYYPSNPNTSSTGYVVPAYATVNLFLGLRSPTSNWEADVYGKNIFNNQTVLNLGTAPAANTFFGLPGYTSTISHTARREFGLTLHYAFGSR